MQRVRVLGEFTGAYQLSVVADGQDLFSVDVAGALAPATEIRIKYFEPEPEPEPATKSIPKPSIECDVNGDRITPFTADELLKSPADDQRSIAAVAAVAAKFRVTESVVETRLVEAAIAGKKIPHSCRGANQIYRRKIVHALRLESPVWCRSVLKKLGVELVQDAEGLGEGAG